MTSKVILLTWFRQFPFRNLKQSKVRGGAWEFLIGPYQSNIWELEPLFWWPNLLLIFFYFFYLL